MTILFSISIDMDMQQYIPHVIQLKILLIQYKVTEYTAPLTKCRPTTTWAVLVTKYFDNQLIVSVMF